MSSTGLPPQQCHIYFEINVAILILILTFHLDISYIFDVWKGVISLEWLFVRCLIRHTYSYHCYSLYVTVNTYYKVLSHWGYWDFLHWWQCNCDQGSGWFPKEYWFWSRRLPLKLLIYDTSNLNPTIFLLAKMLFCFSWGELRTCGC